MDKYYLSCNFERIFPSCAKRVRTYMTERYGMPLKGCCHLEMEKLEPGERIVTNCQSCTKMMEAAIENDRAIHGDQGIEEVSIFEILAKDEQFPWPDLYGERITLQDCFRARGNHELHEAVRVCLRKMNAEIVEIEKNRDLADFDGLFLYRHPSKDSCLHAPKYFTEELPPYLNIMPKEEAVEEIRKRVREYTTERVVCYCNTCTTGILDAGGNAVHLLELMFPEE